MTDVNMLSEPLNRKCVYEQMFVRNQHVHHHPTCVLSHDIYSSNQLRSPPFHFYHTFTLFLAYSFSCHSLFVFALFILLPFLKTLPPPVASCAFSNFVCLVPFSSSSRRRHDSEEGDSHRRHKHKKSKRSKEGKETSEDNNADQENQDAMA